MRRTDDIIHNGKTLTEILRLHKLWLTGSFGERADLRGADLRGAKLEDQTLRLADMRGADAQGADVRLADFRDAKLEGINLEDAIIEDAIGNMEEIKSMQVDQWQVVYTHDRLSIGCQTHSIEMWRKADPRWIAAMDIDAAGWWAKFGLLILSIIDASPANPSKGK